MIFLGLGSNLGDKRSNIIRALNRLTATGDIQIRQVSSLYETEPMGFLEQPSFFNAVAAIETPQPPQALLHTCLAVEKELGRIRVAHWGPRTIDIDLLLYHDQVIQSEALTLPHPQMHLRPFVLIPLLEIAPGLKLSGQGLPELLAACEPVAVVPVERIGWSVEKHEYQ